MNDREHGGRDELGRAPAEAAVGDGARALRTSYEHGVANGAARILDTRPRALWSRMSKLGDRRTSA